MVGSRASTSRQKVTTNSATEPTHPCSSGVLTGLEPPALEDAAWPLGKLNLPQGPFYSIGRFPESPGKDRIVGGYSPPSGHHCGSLFLRAWGETGECRGRPKGRPLLLPECRVQP